MTGEQVLLLVLGFGLGAGAMAIIYEVARWDLARRRLAAELAAAAAPEGAVPVFGDAAPDPDHAGAQGAPAGRHRRGEDTDILDVRAASFAAGLAARGTGPMTADPADHGWQRPSTMIPAEFTARHPRSGDHRTLAEQAGDLAAAPYTPAPAMLPEVPVLPVWDGNGMKLNGYLA